MAAFTDEQESAFLLGVWTSCESSNVRAAQYDDDAGRLQIEFKDGSIYTYACDFEKARSFAQAASKGTWRHQHCPGKNYLGVFKPA